MSADYKCKSTQGPTNIGAMILNPGAGQEVTTVTFVPFQITRFHECITTLNGRFKNNGKWVTTSTLCNHSKMYRESVSGSWSKSTDFEYEVQLADGSWTWKESTRTFSINFQVVTPTVDHLKVVPSTRLERLIAQRMKEVSQGMSSPKKPKSNDLGETIAEGVLTAVDLTKNLLTRTLPKLRPNPNPNYKPEWQDEFHPLEIIFAFGPTAGQVGQLADAQSFIVDPYFEKMVKWQRSLLKSYNSYGSRTRVKVINEREIQTFRPDESAGGSYGAFMTKIETRLTSWVTGRLYSKDTTELEFWNQSEYLFTGLLNTGWDLTKMSYMIDRFVPQIQQLLNAAMSTTQSSGMRRAERSFTFTQAQSHVKNSTTATFAAVYNGEVCGSSGVTTQMDYARSEVNAGSGPGIDREGVVNVADVIADFFDDGIPSIGGWSPGQFLDTALLFVPSIRLTS